MAGDGGLVGSTGRWRTCGDQPGGVVVPADVAGGGAEYGVGGVARGFEINAGVGFLRLVLEYGGTVRGTTWVSLTCELSGCSSGAGWYVATVHYVHVSCGDHKWKCIIVFQHKLWLAQMVAALAGLPSPLE